MTAPLLLHAFSTFATGGPQVRFSTIANRLGQHFRHAVIAMDGNLACRERLDPALDVIFPTLPLRKGDTLGNAKLFRRTLREIRPHRLVTYNWGTIEWAMANRLAVVPHLHVEDGFGPEERSSQIPRRVWMRRIFLAGRTILVPSLTLKRIASEIWRLPCTYVPNGINLARFTSAPRPAGSPIVIGTVAALRPEKNLARLIRAVAAIPDVHLHIVGDGPERPALEALAATLGLTPRIVFAGHIADPAPLLRGFDIFAMSSDTEQMPISLLEAMAAGLPVAATAVGDIPAILPPAQTPLTTALDDAALAAALTRLVTDPVLRATLGQANRARVEADFTEAGMVDAWERLLQG